MKKRIFLFVILIFSILILLCGVAYYFYYKRNVYELEYLEPPVYEKAEHDIDLLIGKWQQGSLFYRFDIGGSGATWDLSDDVSESEGSLFNWDLNKSQFIHYHKMHNGALVPKSYKLIELNLNRLVYRDDYGKEFVFIKVLE